MEYHNQQLWMLTSTDLHVFSLTKADQKLRSTLSTVSLERIFRGTEFENEAKSINDLLVDDSQKDPGDEALPVLLLEEDTTERREMLSEHFAADYSVVEATNGLEALDRMRDKQADFIISDIMMPEQKPERTCIFPNLSTSSKWF